MLSKIIPIQLGGISSPNNTTNKQGFGHCSLGWLVGLEWPARFTFPWTNTNISYPKAVREDEFLFPIGGIVTVVSCKVGYDSGDDRSDPIQ